MRGLPVAFANRILALQKEYFVQVLGDILNDEELSALDKRLNYVKSQIRGMAARSKDAEWNEKTGLSYKGEMADDKLRMLNSLRNLYIDYENGGPELDDYSVFLTEKVEQMDLSALIENRRIILGLDDLE